ncbi:MAG: flagellar biosynthesis protein FlgL [Pseudomonadota bacterium]
MGLPPLNSTFNLDRSVLQVQQSLDDLQRQLATGKKSVTYGGLSNERTLNLSFRGELAEIEGYISSVDNVQIRVDVTTTVLSRIRDIAADTKSDALGNVYDPQSGDQTSFQASANAHFAETISLLNTRVGERYIFSGRSTDQPSSVTPDGILNGSNGAAGFEQIATERRQADLGADNRGRLAIPVPGAAIVTVTEDNATSPFGFKLNSQSSSLTGTTVAGPAGSPEAISATFSATLPNDGESVTLNFDLPDGTSTSLELVATTGTPQNSNEFQIGADANTTATNFQAVLDTQIQTLADTELRAASLHAAASDFFDYDDTTPPQRVNGTPATATSLTNGTTTDTVFWYQGELSSTSARDSALARVDTTITVSHGVRANEEAFRTTIKNLAVLAVETYPETDSNALERYRQVTDRANINLSFGGNTQSVDNITAEFAVIESTISNAKQRHEDNSNLLRGFVDEIEVADIYEVGAEILSLQNRLQATLQVTATLGSISLINFIN